MADPPDRNRHGREIWFRDSDAGESSYAPVHRKGCIAFILAFCWVAFSGTVGMVLMAVWQHPAAILVMFAIGVPGLILMGITVRRHS